jgi:hypothetical protein
MKFYLICELTTVHIKIVSILKKSAYIYKIKTKQIGCDLFLILLWFCLNKLTVTLVLMRTIMSVGNSD